MQSHLMSVNVHTVTGLCFLTLAKKLEDCSFTRKWKDRTKREQTEFSRAVAQQVAQQMTGPHNENYYGDKIKSKRKKRKEKGKGKRKLVNI